MKRLRSLHPSLSQRVSRLFAALAALAAGTANADDGTVIGTTNTITSNGITWTFAEETTYGTYITGDYWVIGPVTVTSITNSLNSPNYTPRAGQNGSMVNPLTGHSRDHQGYDDGQSGTYRANLNAGRPNGQPLTADNPLVLQPDSSLVSMVSWLYNSSSDREPGCPGFSSGAPRPMTRTAGILTVVDEIPEDYSFRPPYCGSDKTARFQWNDVDLSKLPNLTPPASGVPSLASVEAKMIKPWVDHNFEWIGAMIHPSEHMPNYGRDMAADTVESALMLTLDFSKLPGRVTKDQLALNMVQYGIDLYGIAANGGGWRSNGGHSLGRKLPILIAGKLLDDPVMLDAGLWGQHTGTSGGIGVEFQDNQNTFYVDQATVDLTQSGLARSSRWPADHPSAKPGGRWTPDYRNVWNSSTQTVVNQHTPYTAGDIGLPEWGIRHSYSPSEDNGHMNAVYRDINAGIYVGFALAAQAMGLRREWNDEVFFDYADRSWSLTAGGTGTNGASAFSKAMWNLYRNNYPPVWTGIPEPLEITGLTASSGATYEVFTMADNEAVYTDGTAVYSDAGVFAGKKAIRTAQADTQEPAGAASISFTVNRPVDVWVLYTGFDAWIENQWLNDANGWTLTRLTVETDLPGAEATRFARVKYFPAGTVTLNGNGGQTGESSMYTVVVAPYGYAGRDIGPQPFPANPSTTAPLGWELLDDFEDAADVNLLAETIVPAVEASQVWKKDSALATNHAYTAEYPALTTSYWDLAVPVSEGAVATAYCRFYPTVKDDSYVMHAALMGTDGNTGGAETWSGFEMAIGAASAMSEGPANAFESGVVAGGTTSYVVAGEGNVTRKLRPGAWHELWIVVDRQTDHIEAWVRRMPDGRPTLWSKKPFYTDPEVALTRFAWSLDSSHPVYIDDIYVDADSRNLTTPGAVPVPDGSWGGYPRYLDHVNAIDWLGSLYCHPASDWMFSYKLGEWIWFPDPGEGEGYHSSTYITRYAPPAAPLTGPDSWGGYAITNGIYVNTGDWIGWLYLLPGSDWTYSYTLESWVHMPDPGTATGAWGYIVRE